MNKNLKIKICGLSNYNNILSLSKIKPDYMGFIFSSLSKRFIGNNFIIPNLKNILKVGVFINPDKSHLINSFKNNNLDFIQLHGNESPEYCDYMIKMKFKIIKAFRINENFNFKNIEPYVNKCNYFLFDTKTLTDNYGGSGKKFNWNKIYEYNLKTPFFLSGGINKYDFNKINSISHPKLFAIDINSKFEISTGVKNFNTISKFIKKIKI